MIFGQINNVWENRYPTLSQPEIGYDDSFSDLIPNLVRQKGL